MKKKKRRILTGPKAIATVIWTARALDAGDPLRAKVAARLRQELFAASGDLNVMAKNWRVSLRQAQRTVSTYRESGDLADKETLGQQMKRALAREMKA